jgi:hypothetical protein
VAIQSGRPNFSSLLSALDCGEDVRRVGIFTSGPKAFNLAVQDAAYSCGHKVMVDQMAFEL